MACSESRDGTTSGDRDTPYTFGCPRGYLTLLEQGNLQIMRGYVMDVRHGEHGLAGDGDLSYTESTPSGLLVPLQTEDY
jgi:hypothetical protein